jgi:hypothetical protein
MHYLGAQHSSAPDGTTQRGLVQHRPQRGRARAGEDLLPAQAQLDAALDLLVRPVGMAEADHRAGTVLGLQQAVHELGLVAADH